MDNENPSPYTAEQQVFDYLFHEYEKAAREARRARQHCGWLFDIVADSTKVEETLRGRAAAIVAQAREDLIARYVMDNPGLTIPFYAGDNK